MSDPRRRDLWGRLRGDGHRRDDVVRWAVWRFVAGSVVAMVVLMVATFMIGHRIAQREALDEAEERAKRLAQAVGALVSDEMRAGEPDADAVVTNVLQSRFDEGYLWRAKLWAQDGTVLWSDDRSIIGQRFEMEPQDRALFGTDESTAELSSLDEEENLSEQTADEMLEVYVGTKDAEGRPLVFEAYIPTDHMRNYEQAIIRWFVPLGLVGLLLFQAAVLPLAVALGRRVQHSEVARARMMSQALQASELERKRIAQQLHDGVVQDLAAVGFSFPAIRRALTDGADPERAVASVDHLEAVIQRDVAALRSMMIDVFPPDLETTDLVHAVDDLASASRAQGLTVEVRGIGDLHLPLDHARLVYRVAREGLHSVVKHARARTATVTIERDSRAVTVEVLDDGDGLAPGHVTHEGSLGLRLLAEAVAEIGGDLRLTSVPDRAAGGSSLRMVLPLTGSSAPSATGDAGQDSSKAARAGLTGKAL